jgi:hypothetical protein
MLPEATHQVALGNHPNQAAGSIEHGCGTDAVVAQQQGNGTDRVVGSDREDLAAFLDK